MAVTLIRGDNYVLKVAVAEADGSVPDIAGDTMYFTIKLNKTDKDVDAIYQLVETIPAGNDATAGIHRFQIPDTLAVGTLHFDVQWERVASGTGNIITLTIDTFSIVQDVTILPQTVVSTLR